MPDLSQKLDVWKIAIWRSENSVDSVDEAFQVGTARERKARLRSGTTDNAQDNSQREYKPGRATLSSFLQRVGIARPEAEAEVRAKLAQSIIRSQKTSSYWLLLFCGASGQQRKDVHPGFDPQEASVLILNGEYTFH